MSEFGFSPQPEPARILRNPAGYIRLCKDVLQLPRELSRGTQPSAFLAYKIAKIERTPALMDELAEELDERMLWTLDPLSDFILVKRYCLYEPKQVTTPYEELRKEIKLNQKRALKVSAIQSIEQIAILILRESTIDEPLLGFSWQKPFGRAYENQTYPIYPRL